MEFNLPFDERAISGMAGKTMVLAENHRNENMFHEVRRLELDASSECGKTWRFETVKGSLLLLREGKVFCEFCGLESRGGTVYAVGHMAMAEVKHGFSRVVLYESRMLGAADVGVCVSSHVKFEKHTLEPLLKSLRKTGFDMAKVVVVVDGDKKWENWADDRSDGVSVMRANGEALGFAGLLGAKAKTSQEYWLLVHDTCAFEADFTSKLANVEVGLQPDMVLALPPEERSGIGVYSKAFVTGSGVNIERTHPTRLFDELVKTARVVTILGGKTEFLGEKDVYGLGEKRRVVKVPALGIRKFQGKQFKGGRP